MAAKIGESLKRMVDVSREPGAGHGGEFALSNPRRLAAYQAILELAMARSGTVSNLSGLRRKAAHWHLSVLVEAGFVERRNFGGSAYYSPAEAVPDEGTAAILKLASDKADTKILWASVTKPGASTVQFSKPAAARLADAGLVLIIGDGKANRLYPGPELKALSKNLDIGYRAHISLLRRMCHASAVRYRATPMKDGSLDFNFAAHSGEYDFAVPANPFENSLFRRAKLYNLL